jgi:Flp pilus assembly pilin Flp
MGTQRGTSRQKQSEDGASLVEYVLLLSLIFVVCLVSIAYFGNNVGERFSSVGSTIGFITVP